MRIRIHRGTQEIGGTCIEVAAESETGRVVLDLGRPLDAGPEIASELLLPEVPGLREGAPDLLGVLISHPHQDHVGLVSHVHVSTPVGIGAAAQRILDRAASWLDKPRLEGRQLVHWQSGIPTQLGPFTITPNLVDHSAYDAYALLIEADGQRLFYSGDFRGHGRKGALFERMIANPPTDIDVLLMEGTVIGREGKDATFKSEADLEHEFVDAFNETLGITLVWTSAQNLDRIVTIYRAAKRCGRRLVVDAFTAQMLDATRNPKLPQAGWSNFGVYVPDWMRRKIKRESRFEWIEAIRPCRVYLDKLAPDQRDIVLFGPGLLGEFKSKLQTDGARLIYSNWRGYLDEERSRHTLEWIKDCGLQGYDYIHTSGHASVPDLVRLAQAMAPKRLIPIHTFCGDCFDELFANVDRRRDGEWWSVA